METKKQLSDIVIRLLSLIQEINTAGDLLGVLQAEYDYEKANLYLGTGAGVYSNQAMRDSYVSQVLEEKGMTIKLMRAKQAFKKLMTEKEILVEVSSNLRVILMAGGKHERNQGGKQSGEEGSAEFSEDGI